MSTPIEYDEELTVPHFESDIPPWLLDKLDDQQRYVIGTISKIEKQNEWIITHLVDTRRIAVAADQSAKKLERRWTFFSGQKAVWVAISTLIGVATLEALAKAVWEWLKNPK